MSVVGPSKIRVEPQGVGWVILGCGEPLYFRSGAWAVHTARRLATAQALHGAVELLVADRSGRVAVPSHLRLASSL